MRMCGNHRCGYRTCAFTTYTSSLMAFELCNICYCWFINSWSTRFRHLREKNTQLSKHKNFPPLIAPRVCNKEIFLLPNYLYPSCLQTTVAALRSQLPSHTVPHSASRYTSRRPPLIPGPFKRTGRSSTIQEEKVDKLQSSV